MPIPAEWTEEWRPRAKGVAIFGEPLEDLTRDELLAVCALLGDDLEQQRRSHRTTLEFLRQATARRGPVG